MKNRRRNKIGAAVAGRVFYNAQDEHWPGDLLLPKMPAIDDKNMSKSFITG